MNATPDWLRRCAERWLRKSGARGQRAIKLARWEPLEDRAFPGGARRPPQTPTR